MRKISKFRRDTSHLGLHASDYADKCFQAVEDLFEGAWLRKNNGHRLQLLWARHDDLATNELYALGKSILTLKPKHDKWLEVTARTLKKNANDSHGLITEILVCGSMNGNGLASISPSPKSAPGYDLTIRFPSDYKYLVSVKNHDISTHEKSFRTQAEKLNKIFIERLKVIGKNGRLAVLCIDYMTESEFIECIKFVKSDLCDEGIYELIQERLTVVYKDLVVEPKLEFSKSETSSSISIQCGQHPNEQLNFKDKLQKAADNMKKHLLQSEKYFRLLYMRVHSSADIIALQKAAQKMLDTNLNCGFDGVFFVQSSVTRDIEGMNSSIYTVLQQAFRKEYGIDSGFIASVQRGETLNYDLGIGQIGHTPDRVFLDTGLGKLTPVPREQYIYQKTDYYYLMTGNPDHFYGHLSSPASGIHYHAVFAMNDAEVLFKGISPQYEELLIV